MLEKWTSHEQPWSPAILQFTNWFNRFWPMAALWCQDVPRWCSHTNPMEWDNYIDISSTQWSQQWTAHPTTVAVYTYRRSEKSIYIYSMRMYERMSLIFEVNHILNSDRFVAILRSETTWSPAGGEVFPVVSTDGPWLFSSVKLCQGSSQQRRCKRGSVIDWWQDCCTTGWHIWHWICYEDPVWFKRISSPPLTSTLSWAGGRNTIFLYKWLILRANH